MLFPRPLNGPVAWDWSTNQAKTMERQGIGFLGQALCFCLSLLACTSLPIKEEGNTLHPPLENTLKNRNVTTGSTYAMDNLEIVTRLLVLQPNKPSATLDVWTNKMDTHTYQIGEAITFSIRMDRDAYVTLFHIGQSGQLRVLFPNRLHQGNFVQRGQTYSIPVPDDRISLHIDGPPGVDRIKAIATSQPLILTASPNVPENRVTQPFSVFSQEDNAALQALRIAVDRLIAQPDQILAERSLEIQVTEEDHRLVPIPRGDQIRPKPPEPPPIDILSVPGKENLRGGQIQPRPPEPPPTDILSVPGKETPIHPPSLHPQSPHGASAPGNP